MGSKQTTKTNQQTSGTQTNTLGFATPPTTQDIGTLRGMVRNPNEIDPSVAYGAGVRRRDYQNTFLNPLGSATSAATREAADRRATNVMGQEDAVMAQMARSQAQDQAFGQQSYVAQLTAPVAYNSSSSSTGNMTGNQVQSYNPGIGSYIAQGAGAALGMF